MRFYVNALWDDKAGVFYSDSDIVGLHIEAETLGEFETEMNQIAPMLIIENHVSKQDFAKKSLADMIPSIFFQAPKNGFAAA